MPSGLASPQGSKHGGGLKVNRSEKVLSINKDISKMYRTQSHGFFSKNKNDGGSPFIIKSSEIPEMSRKIDFERLLSKPKHRPNRLKFDKNRSECLKEKENNPMTS